MTFVKVGRIKAPANSPQKKEECQNTYLWFKKELEAILMLVAAVTEKSRGTLRCGRKKGKANRDRKKGCRLYLKGLQKTTVFLLISFPPLVKA